MLDDPVVVADDLHLTYKLGRNGSAYTFDFRGRSTRVDALRGVSFVIQRGESVGILGRNGSGKSSLLSILSGKIAASAGSVYVSSTPTLLSVSAALQGDVSGRTNARLGLLARGLSGSEVDKKVAEIGEWTELDSAYDRPLKTYSSGMKARLKFAIATATASEILLVDEALSTGDSTFAIKAKARMAEFLEEAGTIVVVSHSATSIRRQCDRVIWLNEGVVVADGAVAETSKVYAEWNQARARGESDRAGGILAEASRAYNKPEIVIARSVEGE